jgi:hypothetical protein
MKLWVDDVRPAPEGFIWSKSVRQAKWAIETYERLKKKAIDNGFKSERSLELIDIDHDAGDYACDGGDYIKLLDWLEETGRNYPIRLHTMNPVGRENMRAIIRKNGWTEVM